jgi:hypothetical protein
LGLPGVPIVGSSHAQGAALMAIARCDICDSYRSVDPNYKTTATCCGQTMTGVAFEVALLNEVKRIGDLLHRQIYGAE